MANRLTYEQAIALIGELVDSDEKGSPRYPHISSILNAFIGVGCVPAWGDLWAVSTSSHPAGRDSTKTAIERVEAIAELLEEVTSALRARTAAAKLELREDDKATRTRVEKIVRSGGADGKSPF